ncbi:MAG: TylF/MycF family methyltransferase [Verrucomicrobia bacterium]|nr:TylF/MycF family methyltransferase [Verrucomicrobiota bacterium]
MHVVNTKSKPYKDSKDLYIDLMIKVVANTVYEDASYSGDYESREREIGHDHPKIAHTMIGLKRLKNIKYCMEKILKDNIPGDCIETGVWRGGATILMRAILKAYGDQDRRVWVADSFAGLPPPNADKYPCDAQLDLSKIPYLSVSLSQVKDNFKKYDLLDNQVVFLEGFFSKTLPSAPIEQIALLRLDGDLYESTMDALIHLYPKLSVGGFVIIDDFGAIGACAQAVHDYRQMNGITEPIKTIDYSGVYWRKNQAIE